MIHVPSPEELSKPLSPRTAFVMVVEAAKKDPSLLEMAGVSPDFFSATLEDRLHASCTMYLWRCPDLTVDERYTAIEAACQFAESLGYAPTPNSSVSFHVEDPDDMLDDEDVSAHVFQSTGIRTCWYPVRLDEMDCDLPEDLAEDLAAMQVDKTDKVAVNSLETPPLAVNSLETPPLAVNSLETKKSPAPKTRGPYKKHINHLKCEVCGVTFKNSDAKHNHYRRKKCKPASINS